ncbi:AfsR/SARP family transcriptional regulator [Nonomuraea dietziae]|uniref:DNA-binding SARP family transcriptional activator n=1 Tax=Nonomuraea dietziae TaxID=65515 RepID=A0A7W5V831_9ACTN|nr:BTAD domain-containing putative transcriptional regulator [Nonomuraea dietziae]MBB3729020.1 DNA-binding SARP family transcriptional activator [Nonomuraea dietziae]
MFSLLGPLQVMDSAREIPIQAAKQRAILAVLLLRPNRVVTFDLLKSELWAAGPPTTAKTSLQTYVYRLRQAIAPLVTRGVELQTQGSGYLLTVPDGVVDLRTFEDLTAAGAEALAAGDPGGAAKCLREALGMWRGPLLADVDVELVRQERHRLEEICLNTYEMCLEAELRLGRGIHVVPELEQFIAAHPFRETLWIRMMRALNSGGRRMEALAAYRRLYRILDEELGIRPNAEVQLLYQDILHGHPASPLLSSGQR